LKKITLAVLILLSSYASMCFAQEIDKPWERLGLSQTEWKMILDNNLSMSKVEQLLKCGIGIGEYFRKPWEKVHLSEEKWIKKRRSGLTDYDIELEASTREETRSDKNVQKQHTTDIEPGSSNGELFKSLFLPGLYQWQTHQKLKSTLMFSAVAGSVIWCAAGSIANKQFEVIPVAFVLVPDMVWSFIDYKIKKRNESKIKQGKL
jgi:hypothetical protein